MTATILEHLQTFPDHVLAAAAHDGVDMGALIRQSLANRGLDANGEWVGFEVAARELAR